MADKKIKVEVDIDTNVDASIKQLKELKKQLREVPTGTEQWKKLYNEIDDLEDKIKGAKKGSSDWIDTLENAGGPLGMLGKGLNSAKVAFTSLDTAFKATGIGLLVSLIGGLVAAFSQSDTAMKKLQPLFIGLQRILGGIFRAFEPVLDAFMEMVDFVLPPLTKGIGVFYSVLFGLFTLIKDVGVGVGKTLKGIFTFDWDSITEGVSQVAGSIGNAVKAGDQAYKRFTAGTKEQTKIEKDNQAQRQKNNEDAAKKAEELRQKQLEKLKADLDAKIKLETDKENTSRENLKALLDQRMNLELSNAELTEAQKEVIRQEYATKLEDALKTDSEKRKKQREAELDALIQLETDKADTSREELKFLLDARMQEELSNLELSEAQKQVIRDKYAKQLKDAIKTDEDEQKKKKQEKLQRDLDDAKGDFDQTLAAYQALQTELTNSTNYSEQERVQLRKTYADQILSIIDNQFQAETQRIENKYGDFSRFDQDFYDEQRTALNTQFQQLDQLRKSNAITEDEFNKRSAGNSKAKRELDRLEERSALEKTKLVGDALGQLSQIVGQDTVAGKAFAIAKATIDTYQSAVAAYKSLAGIPVIGPALGAIAAGAAVASGIATVKKIVSVQVPGAQGGSGGGVQSTPAGPQVGSTPTAPIQAVAVRRAQGGIVRGQGTETSDSIPALLSDGEFVINARSTRVFQPLLSAINDFGLQPTFAMGGLATKQERRTNDNSELLVKQIGESISQQPIRTYVTSTDISTQQQFDRVIKSRSLI
jgi:hypothetical protein